MKKSGSAIKELQKRIPQLAQSSDVRETEAKKARISKAERDFSFFCEYYLSSYFY